MKQEKLSNIIVRIVVAIAVAVLVIALYLLLSIEIPVKPLAGHGGNISDSGAVDIGGDFELTDQNGKAFSSKILRHHLSLIYFGFTYCPDICPTSLNKLTEVLLTLDKYGINVTPVFITIDPIRDTQEVIKEYLVHFHPKFIGLTGSVSEIKQVADQFKVYYAKSVGTDDKDAQYMIDHSSFIYLLDKNGKYLKHFYFDSTAEEIVNFIRVNKI